MFLFVSSQQRIAWVDIKEKKEEPDMSPESLGRHQVPANFPVWLRVPR